MKRTTAKRRLQNYTYPVSHDRVGLPGPCLSIGKQASIVATEGGIEDLRAKILIDLQGWEDMDEMNERFTLSANIINTDLNPHLWISYTRIYQRAFLKGRIPLRKVKQGSKHQSPQLSRFNLWSLKEVSSTQDFLYHSTS